MADQPHTAQPDAPAAAQPTASPGSPTPHPPTPHPLRLVLMGTGPFAVPAFEALRAAGHTIPLVVTRPARQVRSRQGPPPTPVRQFAQTHGIELYDPPSINEPAALQRLGAVAADLLVVCDFGQILSSEALSQGRLGGINLHGSLLPAYRGAAPVQWAILSGDQETGVCVIHMTPRLDGGPVLASVKTPIGPEETAGELEARLAQLGVAPTLASVELLARWDGDSPLGQPQDPARVSRAPRLDKAAGRIDWNWPAEKIDWHVRGMQPWPGAFTEVTTAASRPPLRVAIRSVSVLRPEAAEHSATEAHPSLAQHTAGAAPGSLLSETELLVATGEGVIRIGRLQVAGKNEVTAEEFQRGYRLPIGTRLGE